MKRLAKIVGIVAIVAALAALVGTTVSAQGPRQGGFGGPIGFRGRGGPAADVLAEELDMTTEELRQAFRDGQTIADLAEEQGVDLADLKDAVESARLEQAREGIQDRVASGDLTQAKADWLIEGLENAYRPMGPLGGRPGMAREAGLDVLAEVLGMTADEVELQLWGGRTIADLAEDAGVEFEAVQEALQVARKQAIRDRVDEALAQGEISEDQADWIIQGLDNDYIPRGNPLSGRGGRRGGPQHGGTSRFGPACDGPALGAGASGRGVRGTGR
jgi:uncharacterized protein (DUF433 family)